MTSLSKLTDLGFETAEIIFKKEQGTKGQEGYRPQQAFSVRGLALEDIMKLMRVHGPDLIGTFEGVMKEVQFKAGMAVGGASEAQVDLAGIDIGQIILNMLEQTPDIVADLITIASDSDPIEGHKIARRLPVPIQLRAFQQIVRLTVEDNGGLGELVETVLSLLGGANGLMTQLRASSSGLIASGAKSAS